MVAGVLPRRVALLSVHTSPLEQPGGGDAGGLNVYVVETARRMADAGVAVEIFTRATAGSQPPVVEMHPGVLVRHVTAGPYEGLGKNDLPAQLCAFTAAVLRAEASREPGFYEVIHSHYWLSGQVGWLARDRWRVPLVHSAHTLAKVKNAALADGERAEPLSRIVGEEQVVAEADRLVAPTAAEAEQLIDLYGADPAHVVTVAPGVDLTTFSPGSRREARVRLGIDPNAALALFVGRLQPLKAPDVLIRAAAQLQHDRPDLRNRLQIAIVGAPSGSATGYLQALRTLATTLGVAERVTFVPPTARAELAGYYRAADVTVVPSYNESFGLVALESEACGTPVVASDVGGLSTTVANGRSGLLVAGHSAWDWSRVLGQVLGDDFRRAQLAAGARPHAEQFSWDRTARELLAVYREAMADFAPTAAVAS
jgi:D-inositol-3-phosphate glycosyltransferase